MKTLETTHEENFKNYLESLIDKLYHQIRFIALMKQVFLLLQLKQNWKRKSKQFYFDNFCFVFFFFHYSRARYSLDKCTTKKNVSNKTNLITNKLITLFQIQIKVQFTINHISYAKERKNCLTQIQIFFTQRFFFRFERTQFPLRKCKARPAKYSGDSSIQTAYVYDHCWLRYDKFISNARKISSTFIVRTQSLFHLFVFIAKCGSPSVCVERHIEI